MRTVDFFKSRSDNGSQFLKGLHKVKHLFKKGAMHKMEMARLHNFVMMYD
jgi:hypothetical protein